MSDPEPTEQISLFDDLEIIRRFEHGRDELNLVEFPICSLYKIRDESVKTLKFTDEIEDRATGESISRSLTVTAADEYGLPSASDDEVILALIQLTKLQGFQDRRVHFTKRQILEILGWNTGGKNTRRVEESLKRWLGVTLAYDQAWRDRDNASWDTQGFHILENVFFREHQRAPDGRQSYIVWNEVVFRSMKAGNLKPLDFGLFKQLRCPTAKRIFRFLDKRFYHRSSLRFDLADFAFQKIGIDRRYSPGQIKKKLEAGISELEAIGYLQPMTTEERYRKAGRKAWNIYFVKGRPDQPALIENENHPQSELEARMEALGVNRRKARQLFEAHSSEYLQAKIEQTEYLCGMPERAINNPAGYLIKSVKEDYEPPLGFKSNEQIAEEQKEAATLEAERLAKREAKEERERLAQEEQDRQEQQRRQEVSDFLDSLKPAQREEFIQKAYDSARRAGVTWVDSEGPFGEDSREMAIINAVNEHRSTGGRPGKPKKGRAG